MVKKNVYELETKSYMMFDKKPKYIGNDVKFFKATSSKIAKENFKKKYARGEMVSHYSGKKRVIYDLNQIKSKKVDYFDK